MKYLLFLFFTVALSDLHAGRFLNSHQADEIKRCVNVAVDFVTKDISDGTETPPAISQDLTDCVETFNNKMKSIVLKAIIEEGAEPKKISRDSAQCALQYANKLTNQPTLGRKTPDCESLPFLIAALAGEGAKMPK